jgi:hypothetical protein
MTDGMIERVARALCGHDGLPENTMLEGKPMWMSFIPEAKVAITAMRIPTEAMIKVPGALPDENRYAWQNMIDVALEDER